jgi:hypothetical protein
MPDALVPSNVRLRDSADARTLARPIEEIASRAATRCAVRRRGDVCVHTCVCLHERRGTQHRRFAFKLGWLAIELGCSSPATMVWLRRSASIFASTAPWPHASDSDFMCSCSRRALPIRAWRHTSPPPATSLPARLSERERIPPPETDARATPPPALETTSRSPLQLAAAPVPRSPARQAKRPAPQVAAESPKPQGSPCLPGYDSSGAQTRSC